MGILPKALLELISELNHPRINILQAASLKAKPNFLFLLRMWVEAKLKIQIYCKASNSVILDLTVKWETYETMNFVKSKLLFINIFYFLHWER